MEQVSRGLDGMVGTPDRVADNMGMIMEEIGGDGFLITRPHTTFVSRQYISDICEGLVPALQRRGLVREAYSCPTLRETLREF